MGNPRIGVVGYSHLVNGPEIRNGMGWEYWTDSGSIECRGEEGDRVKYSQIKKRIGVVLKDLRLWVKSSMQQK